MRNHKSMDAKIEEKRKELEIEKTEIMRVKKAGITVGFQKR